MFRCSQLEWENVVTCLHSRLLDSSSIPEPELQPPASLGLTMRDSLLSGEVAADAGPFCLDDASAVEICRLDYGDALSIESKAGLPDRDFVLCL